MKYYMAQCVKEVTCFPELLPCNTKQVFRAIYGEHVLVFLSAILWALYARRTDETHTHNLVSRKARSIPNYIVETYTHTFALRVHTTPRHSS